MFLVRCCQCFFLAIRFDCRDVSHLERIEGCYLKGNVDVEIGIYAKYNNTFLFRLEMLFYLILFFFA